MASNTISGLIVAYVVLFVASSIAVATSHPPRLPTGYWLVVWMMSFVLLGTALVTAAFHVYLLLDNRTVPLEGWRERAFFWSLAGVVPPLQLGIIVLPDSDSFFRWFAAGSVFIVVFCFVLPAYLTWPRVNPVRQARARAAYFEPRRWHVVILTSLGLGLLGSVLSGALLAKIFTLFTP